MTIAMYLWCFVAGLLGMALQVFLKLKSLADKSRVGNVSFNPGDYFRKDWLSLGASVTTILIALVVTDELIGFNELVLQYIRLGFAFVGYTGADIASRVFGVMSNQINKVIDYKTDVADGKVKSEAA